MLVKIVRDGQQTSCYKVNVEDGMTVLEVLEEVYRHHDPGIAYRFSCRTGLCTTCMMLINGKPGLSCQIQAESGSEGFLTLAPLPKGETVRDLVKEAKL